MRKHEVPTQGCVDWPDRMERGDRVMLILRYHYWVTSMPPPFTKTCWSSMGESKSAEILNEFFNG